MTEALKACPCPFCGSRALIGQTLDNAWYAMCAVDHCCKLESYWRTEAEAIAAWNTRASERDMIVAWLMEQGIGAMKLMLAAGLPGGTRTERTKARAFADGYSRAVSNIHKAIERGDHLRPARSDAPELSQGGQDHA